MDPKIDPAKKKIRGPQLPVITRETEEIFNQPFVTGIKITPFIAIPKVSSSLNLRDHLGTWKARWGIGRMNYKIIPGLYALGDPGETSPVLVTANYKMSFDKLRSALSNHNLWILVLDTKGINVWCAAGKGTFGTKELVFRLNKSGLAKIISHRDLILPQLGAPGISAHEVKKHTGFKVHYGPINATDVPVYLKNGYKATPEMRLKSFTFGERLALVPIELVHALKISVLISFFLLALGWLKGKSAFFNISNPQNGVILIIALFWAVLSGSVFFPLLLPLLPGRAFTVKGLFLGLAAIVIFHGLLYLFHLDINGYYLISYSCLMMAAISYLALNFTGASTYTSLSGVKKEMRWAVPLQLILITAGTILWLIGFVEAGAR